MHQQKLLKKIVKHAQDSSNMAAVFDIDSTLYNVSTRITQILRAFSQDPHMRERYPKETLTLATAEQHPRDWGIQLTLEKIGLANSSKEFHKEVFDFWYERFHSSDFLKYDIPFDGASDFVNRLQKEGAKIIYLTGRDVKRYKKGTLEVFHSSDFPSDENVTFALKPDMKMEDATFKKEYLEKLSQTFNDIWFFENEPVNVNLVAKTLPQVNIVFYDSTHSGKEDPLPDLVRISGFTEI